MIRWLRAHAPVAIAAAVGLLVGSIVAVKALQTNYLGTVFIADTTTPTQQLKVNSDGSINVSGGGGGGGLSVTDGASFTAGTSQFTPGGGQYNSSPTALTSGDQGTFALNPYRSLFVDTMTTNSNLYSALTAAVPALNATAFNTNSYTNGGTNPVNADLNGNLYTNNNVTNWGGVALGAMANFGTSPGAVKVPGVNAFVTNNVSVIPVPSSSSSAALTKAVSASANVTSLVIKGSAGNLYGVYASAITGGAGFLIIYNGTTAPSTGALTAANVLDFCYFSGTVGCYITYSGIPPANYSTGIVALLSSAATPFTYTTGTVTGALVGNYQ